jgi:acetyl esterase/lipase
MPTRRAMLAAAAFVPALAPPFRAARRAAAQEATPTVARAAVETQRGMAYGEVDGEDLLLDAYLPPAREAPRPAVILIHGGFWTSGSRSDMSVAARELAKAGYVAFSIDYRLLDTVTAQNPWPAQLDDAQRAVRWVRAHADAGHPRHQRPKSGRLLQSRRLRGLPRRRHGPERSASG